jgi:hypothetical protein
MAKIPDGEDPITERQQAGDLADTGILTSPSEPQPPRPPLSSTTADSAPHDYTRSRYLSKKILRPAILTAIGAALLLGAIRLYSSPGELSTPSFATIQLNSTFPIGAILYDVSQTSRSIAKITISVQLPAGVLQPPAKAQPAELWLEVPPGIDFEKCLAGSCNFDQNDKEYSWQWWLDFSKVDPDNKSGVAFATFFVKAHNFGYAFNDVNASAAIPRVDSLGQGSGTPILYTEYYNVTSAGSYDWSSFQPQLTNATEILWDEPVTSGATPGIVAVGINHANEAKDNNKTFFAGALLGLAGGALLAAVQEALHANDERDFFRDLCERLGIEPRNRKHEPSP